MSKIQNLPYFIIIILVIVIFIQRCNTKNNIVTKSKSDTVYKEKISLIHDTIYSKPKLVSSTPNLYWDTERTYLPDTNYNKLRLQYESMGSKLFHKNIYIQPYKLDTFGTATVIDTIQENLIVGQSFNYTLKIPTKTVTITNTITNTIVSPNKYQFYIGGAIIGNKIDILTGTEFNILFKNKKDQIYQIGVEESFKGVTYYKLGTYFKIHL